MKSFHPSYLTLGFSICLLSIASPSRSSETTLAAEQKERAVTALEQDLKTDSNNAELWLHLGFAYRKLGKIDQSLNAFEKTSTLNPHETDAYYMLGLIYESKHQNQDAVKAWKNYLAAETDAEKRAVAEKHIHHLNQ